MRRRLIPALMRRWPHAPRRLSRRRPPRPSRPITTSSTSAETTVPETTSTSAPAEAHDQCAGHHLDRSPWTRRSSPISPWPISTSRFSSPPGPERRTPTSLRRTGASGSTTGVPSQRRLCSTSWRGSATTGSRGCSRWRFTPRIRHGSTSTIRIPRETPLSPSSLSPARNRPTRPANVCCSRSTSPQPITTAG